MSNENKAVFAIFNTAKLAELSVDDLLAGGFTNDNISVLLPDNESTRSFAHEKHTKAPEGTTAGVAAGGAIGGALGLLVGIGALVVPGVGSLVAAGPIMSALAGLGVGGSVGGIIGALSGMGVAEFEAKRYEGRISEGGVLLSVHCATAEQITLAQLILARNNAEDVTTTSEAGTGGEGFAVFPVRQ